MIQLEGTIEIGSTDVSAYVTSLKIIHTRNLTRRPPTFADATEEDRAGAHKWMLEVEFINDMAASSFWADMWDAIETDSGELAFDALLKPGAVGADNPRFTGTFIVAQVDTGGDVGSFLTQRQTYPIKGTPVKAAV